MKKCFRKRESKRKLSQEIDNKNRKNDGAERTNRVQPEEQKQDRLHLPRGVVQEHKLV